MRQRLRRTRRCYYVFARCLYALSSFRIRHRRDEEHCAAAAADAAATPLPFRFTPPRLRLLIATLAALIIVDDADGVFADLLIISVAARRHDAMPPPRRQRRRHDVAARLRYGARI